jgi:RNA methyltransferase, TrmH family
VEGFECGSGSVSAVAELIVLEGFHAVKHALRFGAELERVVAVDRGAAMRLAEELAPDVVGAFGEKLEVVSAEELARLVVRPPHTGVVGIARRPEPGVSGSGPVVLLEEPRDFGNVGAVVRVAAAAGAGGVVVTGERDPWAPEALRGSAGLHFAVAVLREDEAALDRRPLLAFDPDGEAFDPRAMPDDAVLAFGTERAGLSEALKGRADEVLALPMRPGVSSLNLATSVSAVLYAWRLSGGRS